MNKTRKAHCNKCHGDRNHEILFIETTSWSDDKIGISGSDKYEMLKCRGCDRVIIRHTQWISELPEPFVYFYPPLMSRTEPAWIRDMRGRSARLARRLLREIYIGVQNNMRALATMGVRALMEYTMVDSVGDQGTFNKNLAEFERQGFISNKQRDILNIVLEAGHATTHRAYQPTDDDLAACIDIAESVMQNVYVHPHKAALLARRVPKRK